MKPLAVLLLGVSLLVGAAGCSGDSASKQDAAKPAGDTPKLEKKKNTKPTPI